jgi:hypothetical protein
MRANASSPNDRPNHDCAYQERQVRCRFPGAISDGTTGHGAFYCRIHARERGTMIAHQCLDKSQTWNRYATEAENTGWIDENFPREPGESDRDYAGRCKLFALAKLQGIRSKPEVSNGVQPLRRIIERAGELVEF